MSRRTGEFVDLSNHEIPSNQAPSQAETAFRIKRLACVCKQTVVNCLKVLTLYGLVIVHRRIKRIRTALRRLTSH